MSDTENTTCRRYPIQVGPDRIIVQGPNRTRAEFTTMAAARKFIRDLIALEMTGTAGEEPAAAAEFTLGAPGPVISSASALTEQVGIE